MAPHAWLKDEHRWNSVLIASIPSRDEFSMGVVGDVVHERFVLPGGNLIRQRSPSVPVPQEREEVGTRGHVAATLDLLHAYAEGALVQTGLVADGPTEIDGLKSKPLFTTEFLKPWKDTLLESIALFNEVAERGAHENAECPAGTLQVLRALRDQNPCGYLL
jgi:hypothetical protein